ncbi:MAG: hypothetical protein HQL76_07315 [Magnetococcales bacterium]|nr:hypothetical protein [Magnetococcales bacterium]
MPPRATLAKLKKQLDASGKTGVEVAGGARGASVSALEQRLLGVELRLEEALRHLPATPVVASDHEVRLADVERLLAELKEGLHALGSGVSPATAERFLVIEKHLGDLNRTFQSFSTADVERRLGTIEERMGDMSRAMDAVSTADVERRLVAVERYLGEVARQHEAQVLVDAARRLETIEKRLGEMTRSLDAISRTEVEPRLAAVEQRVDQLKDTPVVPVASASSQGMSPPELLLRMWFAPLTFLWSLNQSMRVEPNNRR